MLIPLPLSTRQHGLSKRLGSYNEQVDADFDRFNAESRKVRRRFGIYSVLGAILVVSGGTWAFRIETNYPKLPPIEHRQASQQPPASEPASSTVMVVINPG